MKVLFLGTPDFAVPSLKAITASKHEVVAVVTQPDRAVKRGKIEFSPVKRAALEAGLTILQPERIRSIPDQLVSLGADIAVTAAYGQILDQKVLDAFPRGVINVHASLLPKYRGASPVQSAIMAGETETGVTIMQTALGVDTGDILGTVTTPIGDTETGGELMARLAELGAKLLSDVLDRFDDIVPVRQDDSLATRCAMIKKENEYIDFSRDCVAVFDHIRALSPLPCAKTVINGEVYKIYAAAPLPSVSGNPGEITGDEGIVVGCGSGAVSILELQAPGKRPMAAKDFLCGHKLNKGTVCGKR